MKQMCVEKLVLLAKLLNLKLKTEIKIRNIYTGFDLLQIFTS